MIAHTVAGEYIPNMSRRAVHQKAHPLVHTDVPRCSYFNGLVHANSVYGLECMAKTHPNQVVSFAVVCTYNTEFSYIVVYGLCCPWL